MYYWTILLLLFGLTLGTETTWQKPGCHKIGDEAPNCIYVSVKKPSFFEKYALRCGVNFSCYCGDEIGHTRKIRIPDCVEFSVTTNACRGYCQSWSLPSVMLGIKRHPITSFGQCCNIMESEDVPVKVLCLDGERNLIFKSATSCACYHCKKD